MHTRFLPRLQFLAMFLLTACSQAHLVSIAVGQPTHEASHLPSGHYVLDKSHASMTVKVSHLGLSDYTMQFTKFDADLNFDSQNPEKSSVKAVVDMSSIETNYPYEETKDFDEKLSTSPKWFNTKQYATATFQSTSVTMTGKNTGLVKGNLTFLGLTHPLTLQVTFNGGYEEKPFVGVPALGFSAQATMDRTEWGLDTYVPAIGKMVNIDLQCEFHKQS